MHERLLAADVEALVRTKGYDLVCIADYPRARRPRAATWSKNFARSFPTSASRLVAGRIRSCGRDPQPLLDAGASHVATSLLDTRKYLAAASENGKAAATSTTTSDAA